MCLGHRLNLAGRGAQKGGGRSERDLSGKLVENQLGKTPKKIKIGRGLLWGVHLGPKLSNFLSGSWNSNKG